MKPSIIVKSYLRRFPDDINNRGLSKKIVKENPEIYEDHSEAEKIEKVRSLIRYYKGAHGTEKRKCTGHIKEDYHDHNKRIHQIKEKERLKEIERIEQRGGAKILIFDIETSPLLGYVWRLWQQNVSYKSQLVSESWMILTWSAKWLFDDKVLADRITPEEIKTENDSRVLRSLCALIEEADIIVGHNSRKFDIRQINARRLKHSFTPMLPFEHIDTYRASKRAFDLPSHSLDYLARYLGVGQKMETGGFDLWKRCMNGDEEALIEMERYNIQDVKIQEEVYLKLRPYIKPHPNLGIYVRDNVYSCHACISTDLHWQGQYVTYANSYNTYRCNSCGSTGRSRNTNMDTESKRFLTIGTPK